MAASTPTNIVCNTQRGPKKVTTKGKADSQLVLICSAGRTLFILSCTLALCHHVIRRRRPLRPPRLDQRSSRARDPCRCTTFPLNGLSPQDAAAAAAPRLAGMKWFCRACSASPTLLPMKITHLQCHFFSYINVTTPLLLLTPPPRVKGIPPTPMSSANQLSPPSGRERLSFTDYNSCVNPWRYARKKKIKWILKMYVEERGRRGEWADRRPESGPTEWPDAPLRNTAVLLSVFSKQHQRQAARRHRKHTQLLKWEHRHLFLSLVKSIFVLR